MDTSTSLDANGHATNRPRRRGTDARCRAVALVASLAAGGATAVGGPALAAVVPVATTVAAAAVLLAATLGAPAIVGVVAVRLFDPDR